MAVKHVLRLERARERPGTLTRLSLLEAALQPTNLAAQVTAVVLGKNLTVDLDLSEDDDFQATCERLAAKARELGEAVAADDATFITVIPAILRGGNRAQFFGRGLAAASSLPSAIWAALIDGLKQIPAEQRDVAVLTGFLAESWERNRELAQTQLDSIFDNCST